MNVKDIDVMVLCTRPHYTERNSWLMPKLHLLGNTVTVACGQPDSCHAVAGARPASGPLYGHGVVIPLRFAPVQERAELYLKSNSAKRLLKKVWNGIGYAAVPRGSRYGRIIQDTPLVTTAIDEFDELMGTLLLLKRYAPVNVDDYIGSRGGSDDWSADYFTGKFVASLIEDMLAGENLVFSCPDPVRAVVAYWANLQWGWYSRPLQDAMMNGATSWLTDQYSVLWNWAMNTGGEHVQPLPMSVTKLIKQES